MSRRLVLSIIVLFWLTAIPCRAEDQSAVEKKVKTLIEQLASPHQGADLDPDTRQKQGKASEVPLDVWRKLSGLGPEAFPYLLEKVHDKRYSFTADGGADNVNWTVGRACHDIVRCNLQPYGCSMSFNVDDPDAPDPRTHPCRPCYMEHYRLDDPKEAKTWWEAHKDKSLRELQLEALEWVIAEEAKKPTKYPKSERAHLSGISEKLQSSKDPLPATVPWSR